MKKMLKHIIILVLTGITVFSCGSDNKTDQTAESTAVEKALYKEVMTVHDEVMPKMDDIMKIKDSLRKKHASFSENDSNVGARKRIEQAIIELEEADEAMMQWMRDFQPQDDMADKEKVIDYYKQQKVAVKKVKVKMLNAIADGRNILKGAE